MLHEGAPNVGGVGMITWWRDVALNGKIPPASFPATAEVLARFDLVAFDMRGAKGFVSCGDAHTIQTVDYSPDTADERRALETAMQDYATACQERNGPVLGFTNLESVTQDIERIRIALGENQLSLYGAAAADIIYADLFPSRVRALVVDGTVPPDLEAAELLRDRLRAQERAFEAFAKDCDSRPACTARYPSDGGDIRLAFGRALKRAEASPLSTAGGTVSESQLAWQARDNLSYLPETGPMLETVVQSALEGQAFTWKYDDLDTAGHVAWNCTQMAFLDATSVYTGLIPEVLAVAPHVGHSILLELPCAHWSTKPPQIPTPHASGAPAILVVGGTGDPIVPYEWAQKLATDLESGVLLTREGTGYAMYDACIAEKATEYLLNLTVPAEGTVCRTP